MPAINVPKTDTFDQWRQKFNQLGVDVVDNKSELDGEVIRIDGRIDDAETSIGNLETALSSDIDALPQIFFQNTTPSAPTIRSIWIHSDTQRTQVWNGSLWVSISEGWNVATTTATAKTLLRNEFCVVTAQNLIITLPATPINGDKVGISVGNFTNTTVARNGNNIQGLAENLVINQINTTVVLAFITGAGWRIE
jgi:hypothetical protein